MTLKLRNEKINENFLLDCKEKSGKECNQEGLMEYTRDFTDNGLPKAGTNWLRMNNDPDGHCFYHSMWRFMVMSYHPMVDKILAQYIDGGGEEHEIMESPGWNKKAAGLLREELIKYLESKGHVNLSFYRDAAKQAKEGKSTSRWAGTGHLQDFEYQAMADLLNTCIAIFVPKNSSGQGEGYWTLYCPGEEAGGFCPRDLKDCVYLAFIINSGGVHYETLIPAPINPAGITRSGSVYNKNNLDPKFFKSCCWDKQHEQKIMSPEDAAAKKKAEEEAAAAALQKIEEAEEEDYVTADEGEDIPEDGNEIHLDKDNSLDMRYSENKKKVQEFRERMKRRGFNDYKKIDKILDISGYNLELAEDLLFPDEGQQKVQEDEGQQKVQEDEGQQKVQEFRERMKEKNFTDQEINQIIEISGNDLKLAENLLLPDGGKRKINKTYKRKNNINKNTKKYNKKRSTRKKVNRKRKITNKKIKK
jgi:hypothetical protein